VKIISVEAAEIGKLYLFDRKQFGLFYSRTSSGFHTRKKDVTIQENEPIFLIGKKLVKVENLKFILAHILTKQGIFYLNFNAARLVEI
jgi:hypothetical protein